jgi:hypothetical protein
VDRNFRAGCEFWLSGDDFGCGLLRGCSDNAGLGKEVEASVSSSKIVVLSERLYVRDLVLSVAAVVRSRSKSFFPLVVLTLRYTFACLMPIGPWWIDTKIPTCPVFTPSFLSTPLPHHHHQLVSPLPRLVTYTTLDHTVPYSHRMPNHVQDT